MFQRVLRKMLCPSPRSSRPQTITVRVLRRAHAQMTSPDSPPAVRAQQAKHARRACSDMRTGTDEDAAPHAQRKHAFSLKSAVFTISPWQAQRGRECRRRLPFIVDTNILSVAALTLRAIRVICFVCRLFYERCLSGAQKSACVRLIYASACYMLRRAPSL